jgi:sialate O-acetylesterase
MKKLFIIFSVVSLSLHTILADVKLPRLVGSNMVLQQNTNVKIWGWAGPSERIVINFLNKKIRIRADIAGNWSTIIKTPEAGGPYEMVIKGRNKIELANIMIGEVWICSGQSNMEWSVERSARSEQEIADAHFPDIRLFDVPRKASYVPMDTLIGGEWLICSPESVGGFSAVGYFFGRAIYKRLKVPVGLINASWGGTEVEAWTSIDGVKGVKDFAVEIKELNRIENADTFENISPNSMVSTLYNGMIAPLTDYSVKGVIWYQGEANAGSFERAMKYDQWFEAMIIDWRSKWKSGNFPFLYVQLANFLAPDTVPVDDPWPFLRESQLQVLGVENTAMASAIDLGEVDDIHPRNKQDVGYRLSLCAMNLAYGKDMEYMGPLYEIVEFNGNKARIHFNHVAEGLIVRNKYGYLKGFTVAGEDKYFYFAKARLVDKNTVEVYTDKVDEIKSVRYGWANNPDEANLYNSAYLPASPFRTDDWPPAKRGE